MKKQVVRIAAGVMVSALLVSSLPAQFLADSTAKTTNYITGATYSFTAGAHTAINETVVLNDTENDMLFAGVADTEAPVVATAVWNNPYKTMGVANVNEYVNIRSEANSEAASVGKLYAKGVVTILETLDGWYKISSGNVVGYISADFVIVGDPETCENAATKIATVTATTLKLRKEASTNADVRSTLSKGARLTVIDSSTEGWLKVKSGSSIGYVSADYVKVETAYAYAESKEEEAARLKAEEEARRQAEEERRREEERKEEEKKDDKEDKKDYTPPKGGSGQAVADYAVQFVGNPYRWGGTSLTKGTDCSGFVQSVYKAFGVSLPRTSSQQRYAGYKVSESEMKPGDIVCYSGHVAIYIGGGKIVHAANRRDGIKISNNYRYQRVLAIRRIF